MRPPLLSTSVLGAALVIVGLCSAASHDRAALVRAEAQPIADRGDGTFRNPVLPGHYHDPSVVRVGADYYLTHCPDLVIWHSRDLVNWRPIGRVNHTIKGDIWAPEFIHHAGLFYLYLPVRLGGDGTTLKFTNVVLTAKDPAGPWSAPVDLNLPGIDPGHIVGTDGTRWLYVNQGRVIQLTPDGLATIGEQRKVYDGWPIPDDWITECHCLESPKLFRRGEWFYLVSAQGGTVGPSTRHIWSSLQDRVPPARGKTTLAPRFSARPRAPKPGGRRATARFSTRRTARRGCSTTPSRTAVAISGAPLYSCPSRGQTMAGPRSLPTRAPTLRYANLRGRGRPRPPAVGRFRLFETRPPMAPEPRRRARRRWQAHAQRPRRHAHRRRARFPHARQSQLRTHRRSRTRRRHRSRPVDHGCRRARTQHRCRPPRWHRHFLHPWPWRAQRHAIHPQTSLPPHPQPRPRCRALFQLRRHNLDQIRVGLQVSGNGTLRVALYATGSGTAHFRHFTYHGL